MKFPGKDNNGLDGKLQEDQQKELENIFEQPSQSNISEDVENASENYAVKFKTQVNSEGLKNIAIDFIAGAEWQKQQDNNTIEFAEWICKNGYDSIQIAVCPQWTTGYNKESFTTKELYNIYLKSINTK